MPVYISKNAIKNLPLKTNTLSVTSNGGLLKCLILNRNSYLVGLAKNDVGFENIKENDVGKGDAINCVKFALNALNEIYSLGHIPLNATTFDFDSDLKERILQFQAWLSVTQTGEINSETLLALDKKFSGEEVFKQKKYIGKVNSGSPINLIEKLEGTTFKYELSIAGGDTITINSDKMLTGKIISKQNSSAVDNGEVYFVPSGESLNTIANNPAVIEQNNKNALKNQPSDYNFSIKVPGTNIILDPSKPNDKIPLQNIDTVVSNTPPVKINDPGAIVYSVKSTDNFSNIVKMHYYDSAAFVVTDPYNNNSEIYTFPKRTSFPPQYRSEDARFQFYLNLLYYLNTEQLEGQTTFKEWGMKKGTGYQRYSVSHLDETNIFDNKFITGDSNTHSGLPNYYRFLKRMEALNPSSKIVFDSSGNTNSFVPNAGKNIVIPSKKYADTMYNSLNYRHDEMLESIAIPPENPEDDPSYVMGYISALALDGVITQMTSTSVYNTLSSYFKQEAKDLYKEVFDFFKATYNFAITSMSKFWPRGAGGKVGGEIDITWGIPIYTKLIYEEMIWRKMSKEDELVLMYSKQFEVGVGVALSPAAVSVGLYGGRGNSRKGLGLDLGAGADVGVKLIASTEYEFPIRREETALLTMISTVFSNTIVSKTANIIAELENINLDPRKYLSKMEVSLQAEAKVWAQAQIGLDTGTGQNNITMAAVPGANNGVQSDAVQESQKSYGIIDNIFNNIPGIGVNAQGGIKSGVAFKYEVEYNNNPLVPSKDARVFSKIDLNIKVFTKANLKFNLVGSFLQKLFMQYFVTSNPFFTDLQNLLEYEKGLMLGVNWQFQRKEPSETIVLEDIKVTGNNVVIDYLSNGNLKFNTGSERVFKQVSLFFGTYTGDVDTLCEPGTETKINLNTKELREMWIQGTNYNFNFDNVLSVIKSFEYRKKIGFINFDPRDKKMLVQGSKPAIPDSNNLTNELVEAHKKGDSSSIELQLTQKLFESVLFAKAGKFFFFGGLALDFQVELKTEQLSKVIEFYLKKLYYRQSVLDFDQRVDFDNSIEDQRNKIKKSIKIYNSTNADIEGYDYYEKLFAVTSIFIGTPYATKGLNKFLSDIIAGSTTAPNINYFEALKSFVQSYVTFNSYLNNNPVGYNPNADYGVEDIMEAFSYVINEDFKLEATLEANAGLGIGGKLGLAAEGLQARVALSGFAEINYQGKLYEEGKFTDLEIADPLRIVQEQIHKILALKTTNNRIGIKEALILTKI